MGLPFRTFPSFAGAVGDYYTGSCVGNRHCLRLNQGGNVLERVQSIGFSGKWHIPRSKHNSFQHRVAGSSPLDPACSAITLTANFPIDHDLKPKVVTLSLL